MKRLAELLRIPASDLVLADEPVMGLDPRELIRLTVLETIEQMDRRRDRVPADDPVVVEMLARINEILATMTPEEIEEAERCVMDAARRHRRAANEAASQ